MEQDYFSFSVECALTFCLFLCRSEALDSMPQWPVMPLGSFNLRRPSEILQQISFCWCCCFVSGENAIPQFQVFSVWKNFQQFLKKENLLLLIQPHCDPKVIRRPYLVSAWKSRNSFLKTVCFLLMNHYDCKQKDFHLSSLAQLVGNFYRIFDNFLFVQCLLYFFKANYLTIFFYAFIEQFIKKCNLLRIGFC